MFHTKFVTLLLFLLIGFSAADETSEKPQKGDRIALKKSLFKDCVSSYSLTCLKLDVVSWVDKLEENEDLAVLPGLSVIRENVSDSATPEQVVAELGREFPNDPEARLDAYLMKKITGYLDTHSVKLNFWSTGKEEARGGGGGGGFGGGKKGGGMGYLLAAGAMMKGTLMALAMGGIAAIAGKALMTGLISLVLSAVIGLKALTHHGGHKQTTYEVIAKPIVSHSNTHSVSHEHGGHYEHAAYGRSLDTAPLPLGLRPEYKPNP